MREEPLKSHGIRLDQYFPSNAALQNKKMNLLEETVGPGPYTAFFPEGLHLPQKLWCCRYHLSSKTSKQYVNDLDYYRSCPTSATSLGAWHAGCLRYTPRSKNAFSFPKYPLQFPSVFPLPVQTSCVAVKLVPLVFSRHLHFSGEWFLCTLLLVYHLLLLFVYHFVMAPE